jgi:hypothetical protein
MEDAIFMANVWKTIRENGWQSVVEFGDVDGIDFVANRILESAQQSVNPTGSTGAAFHCSYCQQMVYPPHSHGDNASG